MDNNRHHYHQNLFSKGLLIAVLFFGFFTFGVPARQSSIAPEGQLTTLLVGNPTRFVKSITFNKALQHVYKKGVAKSFLVAPVLNLINLHSRQINTRFKTHSGPDLTRIQNGFVYHVKALTSNTGDDPVSSLG
jgi:hypothetical protein